MKLPLPISVAILAGGENKRFGGRAKSLIVWEGETLITRYVRMLNPLTDDLFIISNSSGWFRELPVNVYADMIPGRGPLSGIHASMNHASNPHVLVLASDMPFLPVRVAGYLAAMACENTRQVIVPCHSGGYEPLFSLWPVSAIPLLEEWLMHARDYRIMNFLKHHDLLNTAFLDQEMIDPDEFMNINSPADLEKAMGLKSTGIKAKLSD